MKPPIGRELGLTFPLIGDPHHEIADQCRARGWLDLYVNAHGDRHDMIARGHDTTVPPKGCFQPGVLALAPARRILYPGSAQRSAAERSYSGSGSETAFPILGAPGRASPTVETSRIGPLSRSDLGALHPREWTEWA